MSKKPISPLRQRMIDDMTARRFKEKVQKDYVRHVRTFAAFLGRSPDTATSEDLRRYQLHMAQRQVSPWTINAAIAALRFFFTVTLERPDLVRPLRLVTEPRRTPVVLSPEEVARLLEAATATDPGTTRRAGRPSSSPTAASACTTTFISSMTRSACVTCVCRLGAPSGCSSIATDTAGWRLKYPLIFKRGRKSRRTLRFGVGVLGIARLGAAAWPLACWE